MEVGLQDKLAANVDHMESDVQGKVAARYDWAGPGGEEDAMRGRAWSGMMVCVVGKIVE